MGGSQVESRSGWLRPKIGGFYPQNGWFTMEKPLLKWNDLGGFPTIFGSTPIWEKNGRYFSGNKIRF